MRVSPVIVAVVSLVLVACSPAAAPPTAGPPPKPAPAKAEAPAAKAAPKAGLSDEVQRLIAAAKAAGETEINVSWSLDEHLAGTEGAKKYETLFNRLYDMNIKINYTPGPGFTDSAARIQQEVAAGQKSFTDLMLGADSSFAPLLDKNVLEEYDYTKMSPRITKEMVTPRNIAMEFTGRIPGITYNTNLVPPAEVPKKLVDVLNPKWKGKIATPPGANQLDNIAQKPEWGADRMREFVRQLGDHAGGLIRVGELNRVISGEFLMLVMDSGGHPARQLAAQGAPLAQSIPEDGATEAFHYLGVPRNSAHPSLSKLYINLVVSEEGQKLVYESVWTDHHNLAGSQSAAFLKVLRDKGVKLDKRGVSGNVEAEVRQAELRKEFENILREKGGGR